MLHIVQIVTKLGHFVVGIAGIPIPDLRPPRETWPYTIAHPIEGYCSLQVSGFGGPLGTGPDQAHIAAENQEQLRQLVKMCSAQPFSDSRHRPVHNRFPHLLDVHRAEFDQFERTAMLAMALLAEQDGTG